MLKLCIQRGTYINLLIYLVFTLCSGVFASQAQNYGLGGLSSGRVNSVTAELETSFAALYNPALIAAGSHTLFAYNTGIQQTHFRSSSGELPQGGQSTWALGINHPFYVDQEKSRKLGLGLTLSGPYQKLRSFKAYRPEDPFIMRYGTSDSQFKATSSLSLEILKGHLYFGGGLSFFLNTAGSAEQTVSGENPNGRMALDVGLSTAAILGLYAQHERTQASLVYHQEIKPTFVQSIDGNVAIGGSDVLHQPITVRSTLYYEPHSLESDLQYDLGPFKTSIGLAWELWNSYEAPILYLEAKDSNGGARKTVDSRPPLKNTLNPRISLQTDFFGRRLTLGTGYQYRPTPVVDLSGSANFLDSSTHLVGLSIEYSLKSGAFLPWDLKWGLFGQWHFMNSREIKKAHSETSPFSAYTFSGNAALYGISLQTAL